MNTSPLKSWLCDAAAEFVEGVADAFIVVSGGATAVQIASDKLQALTPLQLGYSMLISGCWYVAAFVKKNKPPFGKNAANPNPPVT